MAVTAAAKATITSSNTPTWQDTCNDAIAVADREKALSTVLTLKKATAEASVFAFTVTTVTNEAQLVGTGLAHVILQVTPIDTATL